MAVSHLLTRLRHYHRKLNGCTVEYDISNYTEAVLRIKNIAREVARATDTSLKDRFTELASRFTGNEPSQAALTEGYAIVYEAIRRVLMLDTYDEQLAGALALNCGRVVQMQTGEGKTLAAVFPACVNALARTGVHVLTFNDYLARRDAAWMGPVYRFLGLSVDHVVQGMPPAERRRAYGADITYLTAKESGFDFLRDSLCYDKAQAVHRGFGFAIVDEADSIMIDEARIPLVIAGVIEGEPADSVSPGLLSRIADQIRSLAPQRDFEFDTYSRNVHLTDAGLERVERALACDNLYAETHEKLLARVYYALHAEFLLHRDRDYIVRGNAIELVDDFTGRVADKRRWPDGLQAAIEAKEHLVVRARGRVLNSIPLQYFLGRYRKLCGMTATAEIAEEEFREFYGLHVVIIPQHRPCIRQDFPDRVFTTKQEKLAAIVTEILRVHASGRPLLVGTRSVRESEELASRLRSQGVTCDVLNAREDAFEAEIVARAGMPGAVTISTNMAGRGTDIRLGGPEQLERQRLCELGGLYVIGTNRHESLRIDTQLRGRAGRQGDPGSSRFFISLDDDLFEQYRLRDLIPANLLGGAVDNETGGGRLLRGEIDRIQRIIEGQHLEVKKTLCTYTALIEQQRRIVADYRAGILDGDTFLDTLVSGDIDTLEQTVSQRRRAQVVAHGRLLLLSRLDRGWSEYLAATSDIRESIHLRRFGAQDPLFEFRRLVLGLFEDFLSEVERSARRDFAEHVLREDGGEASFTPKAPSATWTYLVNDNPWEDLFAMTMTGNVGFSAWAGLLFPLTGLYLLLRRLAARPRKRSG